jgi:hypothetical protein
MSSDERDPTVTVARAVIANRRTRLFRRRRLQAPNVPTGAPQYASRVQFDLRQRWEISLDHVVEDCRLFRVRADGRFNE